MQSSVIFVTSVIDTKTSVKEETVQFKLDCLRLLLNSFHGEILIFADRENAESLKSIYTNENIKIILFDYPVESWIYRESLPYKNRLPNVRNDAKDTFEHLCQTQMKIEMLQKAIEIAGQNTFFYMDANIYHLFPDFTLSFSNYINYLCLQRPNTSDPVLSLPYCWGKQSSVDFNNVCWRFCGAVLYGNAPAINHLHNLYVQFYSTVLKEKNTMTWDINFLAHLETMDVFHPVLYKANHNISIVNIPTSLVFHNLSDGDHTIVKYHCPDVPGFFPSSASYQNKHLCIRYVNYKIGADDKYTVFNVQGQLQTVNVLCCLSDDLASIVEAHTIDENAIGIPTYMEGAKYTGLEDVRLFGNMEFVASSATYTADHSIRIVKGAIRDGRFVTGAVLQPPVYTPCEKNWIPLDKKDCYIYRWHPYEIIKADANGSTQVIMRVNIPNILFNKVRGSTAPVWSNKDLCYICVVHWAERSADKGLLQYYHMLVRLNKDYLVIAMSQPFCFTRIGIQYCLGFTLVDAKTYGFWFSENDGDTQFMCSCSNQFFFHGLDGKFVDCRQ